MWRERLKRWWQDQITPPVTVLDTAQAPPFPRPDRIYIEGDFSIRIPCGAPAPLVANGVLYVGCQLDKDHEELHKVEITWGS